MASPSGSAPEIPPVPPASASPPSTESPPPAASPPTAPQPDVPTAPPTSSSPPPVPGSPPPDIPPPTVTPIPSSPPPISPPPDATPPLIASPPPPSQAPPPASPPEASPPPPSAAPPLNLPPPPSLPTPYPPTVVPSPPPPPVAAPPSPATAPPPPPAEAVVPTPPASLPPASPLPPSTPPPPNSPPPASLTPPPVTSLPPTPSKAAPPTPTGHPPSPPAPDFGLPPPPDSQTPAAPVPSPPSRSEIPSPSPPSENGTQSTPVSPPGRPSLPPSFSRSPPDNPTPSGLPSPSPVSNGSLPGPPVVPASPAKPSTRTSNSTPVNSLPGDISFSEGGGIKTGTAVGIAVAVSLVVLGFMGVVVWFVNKRKKQAGGFAGGHVMPSPFNSSGISESSDPRSPTPLVKSNSSNRYSPSDPGLGHSRPWFTYEELSDITDGFSSQNLLGEGGFGCVYKGRLPDGREVAVKQLKVDGGQGEREFRAEVEIISRVHHRHLVSLVGYCISEDQKLLIYDYVPNNTLHYHLHEEGRPVMQWTTRLRVASGSARGLAYLHEDCHPRIIHRDIKSSNILLDNNFEALVSDFGLAKLAVDANTHVTTRVIGTFGYLAPEYASSGKLTSKSDVFSFGVVLLELVTGRKPVDSSQPVGDESLVEWARPLMIHALETGEFEDLPDPRLEKNYNPSEMFRMIEVAAACVRHSAAMRPHMGQVVRALDGLGVSTDLHNGMAPGQSELFDSAQQSEEIRLFQKMAFGDKDHSSDFSHASWSQKL